MGIHDARYTPEGSLRVGISEEDPNGIGAHRIGASEVARTMVPPGRIASRMHVAGNGDNNKWGSPSKRTEENQG